MLHLRALGSQSAAQLGLALLCGATVGGAPGCFSSSSGPQMRYFRIPLWEGVARHPGEPVPAVIQVESMDVVPDYDHLRIVYRVSPVQLSHYRLRQWVVKPGRLLQGALQRFLEATGAFRAVTDSPRPIPSHVLRGRLYSLEQLEEQGRDRRWFASVDLELTLHRASDNQVIWRIRAPERAEVKTSSIGPLVATLTRLLRSRLSAELPGLLAAVRKDLAAR